MRKNVVKKLITIKLITIRVEYGYIYSVHYFEGVESV